MNNKMLWGAATSAFQIEGHINNDMTDWEDRGLFAQNGNDPKYANGSNHWELWPEDFNILGQLNVNAYRLSIEWARIQPAPDKFDETALQQYENMLTAHQQIYQIIKRENSGAQVGIAKNFIVFKPGSDWLLFDKGLCKQMDEFYNRMILKAFNTNQLAFKFPFLLNYSSEVKLNDAIDFWGINYYYRMQARLALNIKRPMHLYFKKSAKHGNSQLGWENYPKGLTRIIKQVHADTQKPMMITENGLATDDDRQRIAYLKKHLKRLEKARKKGYPVNGYFYWSFLDNYEWPEGKKARFGLIHVDYQDQFKRSLKPSAVFYANYLKSQNHRSDARRQ